MGRKKSDADYQSVDDPDIRANGEGKPVENKADKFRRLANRRVPAAIKRINHVTNLFAGNSYESTVEQRTKVIDAIKAAYNRLLDAHNGTKSVADQFSL